MKNNYNVTFRDFWPFSIPSFRKLVLLFLVIFSVHTAKGQAWNNVGSAGFTAGTALYTDMAIDANGTPYIVYQDGASGTGNASVMKFNGTSWVIVGSAGFSAGQVNNPSIAIDPTGLPYVVYQDMGTSGKATVMKYNGTAWVNVGTPGFSAGTVGWCDIAIDGSGNPFVVYMDVSDGNKATVMEFTGGTWVTLGGIGISAGQTSNTTIAIDASGTPYIGYEDYANSYKATVMKYSGGSWVTVGTPGFSTGAAGWTCIALDASGNPYISFADGTYSNKATVMKFSGGAWTVVGTPGFSGGTVRFTNMVVDGSGTPYLTYEDYSNSNKATVMKFNGTSWVSVLSAGFSAGQVYYPSIVLSPCGNPIVGYEDFGNSDKATVMTLGPGPITGANTLCAGSATTLSDDLCGGKWSSSNLLVATVGSGSGVVSGVSAGTAVISYIVYGNPVFVTVTVNPLPVAGTISGPSIVCTGTTITLTDASGGGSWGSSTTNATVGSTGIVDGVSAGGAVISYTVTNSCGSVSATKLITISTLPYAGTITGTTNVCAGSTTLLADASAGAGIWSSSAGTVATIGSTGILSGVSAGTAIITYLVSNSCGSSRAFKTVTVFPLPVPGTITGASTVCVGTSTSLTDTSPGGVWTSSASGTVSVGTAGVVRGVVTGTAIISYSVTNSCGTLRATDTLTVDTVPSVGMIFTSPGLCAGSSFIASAISAGVWSTGSSAVATIGSTGLVTGVSAGTTLISMTLTNSCGSSSVTSLLTVYPLPNAGEISGTDSICPGDTVLLSDTISAGTWLITNTSLAVLYGPGNIARLSSGEDTILYIVSNTWCSDTSTFGLIVKPIILCPDAIKITGSPAPEALTVFPNPNHGFFTLNLLSHTNEEVQIIITNLIGEKVIEFPLLTNKDTEVILNAGPGVYFISAIGKEGRLNQKIVIQ